MFCSTLVFAQPRRVKRNSNGDYRPIRCYLRKRCSGDAWYRYGAGRRETQISFSQSTVCTFLPPGRILSRKCLQFRSFLCAPPPPAAVLSGGKFCARGRSYVQAMAEDAMAANSVELPPFRPQQGPERQPFGSAEGCSTFPQAPTRSGLLSDGVGSVKGRPKQSAAVANEPTGGSIRSLISAASAEASCTAADGSSTTRNSRPRSRPPKMTMPYLRRECSKVLNDWF